VAEADNLSPETIRKYKLLFQQLDDFAKNKGFRYADQFDLTLLDEFRGTWKDGPLSAAKKIERMRGIFKFAVKRGFVERNVMEDMTAPEVKPNPTLPFSEKEMEAILKAATNHRVNVFIQVMRYSGLRVADTTTLATSSLDGRRLRLHQAKTGQPVSILLPQKVVDQLRKLPRKNPLVRAFEGSSSRVSMAEAAGGCFCGRES
jgi:site-specific recombinase XerD